MEQAAGESELPKPNGLDGREEGSVQDPPTRKIIKTKEGHTIQFEDKDGEEMIVIVQKIDDSKRNVITMNKDGIKITDGANGHEVVLGKDAVTIKSTADVIIKGKKINLESTADVIIKGKNINIEATSKLTAKGNPIHLNP